MFRKWLIFTVSAALFVGIGVLAGPGLSKADDEETPLGKIMEKVNKNNSIIQKGTRSKVAFAKDQKKVAQSAKDIIKLAKEAKPIKDAVKKATVADAQKKWDEFMDQLIKTTEKLYDVAGKSNATQKDAKDAFDSVKKACADCHKDFRVDETKF
jgi:cytochrome c556